MPANMDGRWPARRQRTEPRYSEMKRREAMLKGTESEVGPTGNRSGWHSVSDGTRSEHGSFSRNWLDIRIGVKRK